jgi:Uma2 family endonuclease
MPNAVLIVRELEAALEAEQKKRQHFYESIDESKKMEFINGDIYFQSPAKLWHTQAVGNISQLLGAYVDANDLGIVGIEKLLISLSRNDYEPDVCFFAKAKSKTFVPKQMQFPSPDFVVEVLSESTERHDRETKFQDYAAHGVSEYWIVDPENETVEQYMHQDGEYELLLKSQDGHIKSVAVDGLSIPVRAIFDKKEMMNCLREILASARPD